MEKGSIKVSVMYPNGKGKTFDMDYYCNQHLNLIAHLLGDSIKAASIDSGLASGIAGSPASYLAIGHLYFDSLEAFLGSFGCNASEIMADTPNYTNIEPVVQVSKVMM